MSECVAVDMCDGVCVFEGVSERVDVDDGGAETI